jgi:hypothetical protein
LEREHRERVVATAAAAADAKINAPATEEDDFKSVDDWMASGGYDNTADDDEKSTASAPKSSDDGDAPPKTPKSFSLPQTKEEIEAFNKLLEQSNFSSVRTPDAVTYTELRRELNCRDDSMMEKFEKILQRHQLSSHELPPAGPKMFRGNPVNLSPTFDFSKHSDDPNGEFGKQQGSGAKSSRDYGGVDNPFPANDDDDHPGTHRKSTNPFDDDDGDEANNHKTPARKNHRSARDSPTPQSKSPYTGMVVAHSPINDPKRGKMNYLYLWGERGCPHLPDLATDEGLWKLGFEWEMTEELMPIIEDLLDNWSPPDVKPKYIETSFKKLDVIDADSFIDWYTHLCQDLSRYNRGVHPRIFMSLKKGLSVTPTLSQVWQGIFY